MKKPKYQLDQTVEMVNLDGAHPGSNAVMVRLGRILGLRIFPDGTTHYSLRMCLDQRVILDVREETLHEVGKGIEAANKMLEKVEVPETDELPDDLKDPSENET